MHTLEKIVERASELDKVILSKTSELLDELVRLEFEIESSDLEEDEKTELREVLERIRQRVLLDYSEVNAFKRIYQR